MRRQIISGFTMGLIFALSGSVKAQNAVTTSLKTADVTYAAGVQDRIGYMHASATVNYKLIVCQGEVHLAYGLASTTPTVSENYNVGGGIGGTFVKATLPPPELTTTTFKGGVTNGYTVLGTVADEATGKALGYGCLSGQTKLMRLLKDVQGYHDGMTPEEITELLDGYIIEPDTLDRTLKNVAVARPRTSSERESHLAQSPAARKNVLSPSGQKIVDDDASTNGELAEAVNDHVDSGSVQRQTQQQNDGSSSFFVCALPGGISPIYKIDAAENVIQQWQEQNYPMYGQMGYTMFLKAAYLLAASRQKPGVTFNTRTVCAASDDITWVKQQRKGLIQRISGEDSQIIEWRNAGGDAVPLPFNVGKVE